MSYGQRYSREITVNCVMNIRVLYIIYEKHEAFRIHNPE